MTDRRAGRDLRTRLREVVATADKSLVPSIVAVFVLVLILSAVVALGLENRLTRQALERQSRSLLANDLQVVIANTVSDQTRLATQTRTVAENLSIDLATRPAGRQQLVEEIARLERAGNLALVNVFSPSGVLVARAGEQIVPPPPQAFEQLRSSDLEAVVPTTGGGWAQVVATSIGRAPNQLMLVAGHRFGDARALELRNLTGAEHLLLVVDGTVVGTTALEYDGRSAPGDAGSVRLPQELDTAEGRALIAYHRLPRSSGTWQHDAVVGLLVPSPLGPLDASLLRNRLAMVAILIALAALLAWASVRVVIRPLGRLAATAGRISRGDLGASFDTRREDEIGLLASALERMRTTLLAQVELISEQAAALQSAANRVVTAQDEERRRLSRDLHDGLQQRLVMLRLQAGRLAAALDGTGLGPMVVEMAAEIDEVMARLRETGQAIYPSILHDRGLAGGLRSLAGRSPTSIDLQMAPDPLPRLPVEIEANVYFIVTEAVANALKHAEADRIRIRARVDNDRLHLTIEDGGRGFEHDSAPGGGLVHMQDRARALGGELQVSSSLGQGTRIEASFPLGSAIASQEEQHRGDPAVELRLITEPELAEDGVGVLLDRPLRDVEVPGDRSVPPT